MKSVYLALFCALAVFSSCKKEEALNPCKDVSCPENQYCSYGECVCLSGFVGVDCDSQLTPTSIQITKVRLTSFPPLKPNGSSWDWISTANSADVYFVLIDNNGHEFYRCRRQQDQLYNEVTSWDLANEQVYIPSPYNKCTILLRDEDVLNASDDDMGSIAFSAYSSTAGFPATLYINDGSAISFELDLKYTW